MVNQSGQKEELRRHFLNERQKLSKREVTEKSSTITQRLIQMKLFKTADIIHSYVSIQQNNEVDTKRLIEFCFESKKKIVVPKILGEGRLNHFEIESLEDLDENSWGVPEPTDGKRISIKILDLIIVPMVAGDHYRNRVGYGKGYYDRFLEKSTAVTIGLLFDCQLFDKKLPIEDFDIPLDILLTESQRIE